jgi:hypothetical protein
MKRLLLVFLLLSSPAFAAQSNFAAGNFPTVSPYAGSTFVANANSGFAAANSMNSGASAPSYQVEGTLFANSSSGLVELYSGSNWLNWGSFSTTQFVPVSNGVPLGTCPTSTGSSNAYAVTYSPAPTAYVAGQPYCFLTNFSNTGSATVNVNTLGAKTLTKIGGTNLASADLGSGVEVVCIYDGTNCEIISQVASSAGVSGVSSFSGDGTLLSNSGSTGAVAATRASAGSWSVYSNSTSSSAAPTFTPTPSAQAYYLGTTQATAAGKTGLHSPASNAVAIEANGNDAFYITSSSKVGINNTSPTDYLDVGGAIGITATSAAPTTGVYSSASGALDLSTSSAMAIHLDPSGTTVLGGTTSTTPFGGAGFGPGRLVIDVGNSSTHNGIELNSGTASFVPFVLGLSNSTTGSLESFVANATVVGSISTDGSVTTYNTTSDSRLKENVRPLTGAAARIEALNPVTYDWKYQRNHPSGTGFLAQDVYKVIPEAVHRGDDGEANASGKVTNAWGIDMSKIVPYLVAEEKAQMAEMTRLKARVRVLESRKKACSAK